MEEKIFNMVAGASLMAGPVGALVEELITRGFPLNIYGFVAGGIIFAVGLAMFYNGYGVDKNDN